MLILKWLISSWVGYWTVDNNLNKLASILKWKRMSQFHKWSVFGNRYLAESSWQTVNYRSSSIHQSIIGQAQFISPSTSVSIFITIPNCKHKVMNEWKLEGVIVTVCMDHYCTIGITVFGGCVCRTLGFEKIGMTMTKTKTVSAFNNCYIILCTANITSARVGGDKFAIYSRFWLHYGGGVAQLVEHQTGSKVLRF